MNRSMPSPGGNPHRDNVRRLNERALHRVPFNFRLSTPGGRRRKKAVLAAELPRYRKLIKVVAADMKKRRTAAAIPPGPQA